MRAVGGSNEKGRGESRADERPADGALPTFLIIGAPKCATTSLHRYLGEHPEIQMSREKELRFFIDGVDREDLLTPTERRLVPAQGHRWRRGRVWYERQFDPTATVRGETSPGYMLPWYGCAERIAQLMPLATLVLSLRDPVERAISAHRFNLAKRRERRPIDQALSADGYYAKQSRYASNLLPFLERFPREQFHFVETEHLAEDPAAVMRDLYSALGADPTFTPSELGRRWNVTGTSSAPPGINTLLAMLRRRPWWSAIGERAPSWVGKRTFSIDAERAELPSHERPSAATLAALRESLGEEAERLRQLTGLAFSRWSV